MDFISWLATLPDLYHALCDGMMPGVAHDAIAKLIIERLVGFLGVVVGVSLMGTAANNWVKEL